tara:strand:+ start:736 stop:1062 length:327 start_codon:yes stop_codon:yes gene_type:complete
MADEYKDALISILTDGFKIPREKIKNETALGLKNLILDRLTCDTRWNFILGVMELRDQIDQMVRFDITEFSGTVDQYVAVKQNERREFLLRVEEEVVEASLSMKSFNQ